MILLLAVSSGPTKGVKKSRNSLHICYCHTPMRYIWDMKSEYIKNLAMIEKIVAKFIFPMIKIWDFKTSQKIDKIICNSNFVKKRINLFSNRDSKVIHPPINIKDFHISNNIKDYYLILSQMVSYKRVDIAVNAFNKSKKKLLIVGEGEQYSDN